MSLKTLIHYLKHNLLLSKRLPVKDNTCTDTSVVVNGNDSSCWGELPLELLRDVLMRVEVSESTWPMRKNVVLVAGVCKRWRSMVKEIVSSRKGSGMLTFPTDLKQPGSVGFLIKCLIKRNRRTQTYKLYLSLNEASNDDGVLRGKFLLAARRFRRAKCTDYIISLSAEDISEESSTYMGKLRSKFLGTKFTVYDSSAGSYPISSISYEVNAQGPSIDIPGTMRCVLNSIPTNATEPGLGPTPTEFHLSNVDHFQSHQLLWCGCFNFSVTASSLKKLQLIFSLENESGKQENKNVILQYGRVGKDVFTVDYHFISTPYQRFRHLQSVLAASTPSLHGMIISIRFAEEGVTFDPYASNLISFAV